MYPVFAFMASTPHCHSHLPIPQYRTKRRTIQLQIRLFTVLASTAQTLRVYFEKLWYLSCNGVQGAPTLSHDCSNYFKSCDYPSLPLPPRKKTSYRASSESLEASISLTNPWTQPSRASFYFHPPFTYCIPSLLRKLWDLQNNNCKKRVGERVSFSSPLSLVRRAKYQGRTY